MQGEVDGGVERINIVLFPDPPRQRSRHASTSLIVGGGQGKHGEGSGSMVEGLGTRLQNNRRTK